ncbi:lyase [Melittangium boletus]|uniref:Lyase n=1 Tax=Melittangium boletus DSM 14713 TaxID=1294270 RepID=A0A250ICE6_9BACT|nr:lyase [Melittangium boletus]ATB29519.1 lyase [Melittangium boletus DSM 14713]
MRRVLPVLVLVPLLGCGPESALEEVPALEVNAEALAVPTLASPPQAAVDLAIAAPLGRFGTNASGGRYCVDCHGQSILLAVASFKGNTSADARLLQQIRYVIGNGRDPFGNGGYMAQHERMMTGMFALAKRTPRVWNQLTATEVQKIDLIMKATLVGSAYTTSDASYLNGAVPTGIDGDTNLNRGWNPNYREGMVGAMLVSTLYLGGRTPTEAFLNAYSHASFVTQLQAQGLTTLHKVFNTAVSTPSAGAPSASKIQAAIKNYRYKGLALDQLFDIYVQLANDTFSATVDCGLNNGAGVALGNGESSGYLVTGCSQLPNKGKVGQLKEFRSNDAQGSRSATFYAYDGFKPHLINHAVLVAYGAMPAGTSTTAVVNRISVGAQDLFFKVSKGYRNYAKGKDYGLYQLPASGVGDGFQYNRPLWEKVIAPAHGL